MSASRDDGRKRLSLLPFYPQHALEYTLWRRCVKNPKLYDRRQMLHRESPTLVVRYD